MRAALPMPPSSVSVAIHTSSPVIATERNGSRWTVKTASGEVSAEWIIVATDAYSTGPWEQVRSEQVHLPYFNFATVPLGHNLRQSILPGREGAWDTKEILSSFRMDQAYLSSFSAVLGRCAIPGWPYTRAGPNAH